MYPLKHTRSLMNVASILLNMPQRIKAVLKAKWGQTGY